MERREIFRYSNDEKDLIADKITDLPGDSEWYGRSKTMVQQDWRGNKPGNMKLLTLYFESNESTDGF